MNKSIALISQKKNRLREIWLNLKHSIFDVLFVVLDKALGQSHDVTIMSLVYESGIDYIQMMQFPFNFNIIMVWNGGETLNNIFNLLSAVLSINTLMPGINYTAFLIFLYLVIFSIVLIILDIVYVSYSFTKKKFRFTLPLVLLAQIVPLFVTFLFIPVFQILLNIINCNPSQTDPSVQVLQYFPNVQCFTGTHLIHASITLFFTTIFVFISTVVGMTLFEPRMTANTIVSRRSSDGQIIFIVNKIICQFFFSFTPFDAKWPYILLMFVPALWLFYFYHFKQPYYNKNVGKLYRIFSSYYFWTVLMLTISQLAILLNFNFQGSMVIWFCGLPFIALSIAYQSKSNINNLFTSNLKFKTGEELQSHLNYVLQLINNRQKDANANMLLVGYIQKHIETCVQDDCPIKIKKKKKEQKLPQMQENCNLLIMQIERMYKQGIKKFPKSTKLHISFAFFYMERLHNQSKAYQEFVIAEKLSPSFIQEFIIYRFKKIIKEKLQDQSNLQNDLIEVIRFDNHVMLCEEAMLISAKLHKEFWSQLIEETPNLHKLNEIGGKIIEVANAVKFNYVQVNKINSHSPEIIYNYGIYSMFISQAISEGKHCLTQAKKAYYQKISKNELLPGSSNLIEQNEQNYSILISASQNSLGKILAVNDSFIELTGYLKQEITQKSMDKILPQVMVVYHEYAISRWIKDSSCIYMNDQKNQYFREIHKGFIKQKNGFILPVYYRVKYNVLDQKFVVYFKNQRELGEELAMKIYIITDNKGIIREISALGQSYFKITKDNLNATDRYIDELGINFNSVIYESQEKYINIVKRQLLKSQYYRKNEEIKQMTIDVDEEENEEFLVMAEKIMMPFEKEDEEESQLNSLFIKNKKKNVGTIFKLQRLAQDSNNEGEINFGALQNLGKDILQIYEVSQERIYDKQEQTHLIELQKKKQSHIRDFVINLRNKQAENQKERTFKNYAEKIKTYRLSNNELKRLFEDYVDILNSFNELDEEKAVMSTFFIEKLKKPNFVQKIKKAINTSINHQQVGILKLVFFIFLICLITIAFGNYLEVNTQLGKMTKYMNENNVWVRDQYYLSNLLHYSLSTSKVGNDSKSIQFLRNYSLTYNITFDPEVYVQIEQADGSKIEMKINQGMIWIQGNMVNLFEQSKLGFGKNLLLRNYYLQIYPALQSYQTPFEVTYTNSIIFLLAMTFASTITIIIWIYISMKIDIKCGNIILWFLYIPVNYVSYLQSNCITFIKSFTSVKELMQKCINFHDKNLYLEQFKRECESDLSNEKFNEENKERRTMIARYKKKTFLSHCECTYIQLFWLLFYSLTLSLTDILFLQKQIEMYKFINRQWQKKANQLLWSSTIPNNLRLLIEKNETKIGSLDLWSYQKELERKFLNPISDENRNQEYLELLKYGGNITNYFIYVFKGNICEFEEYQEKEKITCKSYLSGKLEGGISAIFSYYKLMEYSQYISIEYIQYDYINKYLLNLFEVWKREFNNSLTSKKNTLLVCLALYVIITVLGFIIVWGVYLKRLNLRLNQSIQMLNMIPIKMLPQGRKDVSEFFNWIIVQANKNKSKK